MKRVKLILFLVSMVLLTSCGKEHESIAREFAEQQVEMLQSGNIEDFQSSAKATIAWLETLSDEEKLEALAVMQEVFVDAGFPPFSEPSQSNPATSQTASKCPYCNGKGCDGYGNQCIMCEGTGLDMTAVVFSTGSSGGSHEDIKLNTGHMCGYCGGSGRCPICKLYGGVKYGDMKYCDACGNTHRCPKCGGNGIVYD